LVHRYELAFDFVMAMVIIANSLTVGLELQWELEGKDYSMFSRMEHIFLAVFVLELILRAIAGGLRTWRNEWFRFDLFLVSVGMVSSWLVEPVLRVVGDTSSNSAALDGVSGLIVLRVLRLLRLARALRVFRQFREMWKLVSGLLASLRTVLSACALLLGAVYVFACVGLDVITKNQDLLDDQETNDLIQSHFSSLHVTILTLFRFTNSDGMVDTYTPLVKRSWPLVFYFGSLWLVVTVCLMNLVTAVIVDKAIVQGGMDRELQKADLRKKMAKYTPYLYSIFSEMDSSGRGELQFRDIQDGIAAMDRKVINDLPEELQKILISDQLVDLFEFLDADDSGTVDQQEFLHGISHLLSTESLHSVPIETTQALHLLRSQSKVLEIIRDLFFQGDRLRLASDHHNGANRLSLYAKPRLQVGQGNCAERASVKSSFFNIHLDKPLTQAHPMNSYVVVDRNSGNRRSMSSSMSSHAVTFSP
jgi:voltage-gated sodium channel